MFHDIFYQLHQISVEDSIANAVSEDKNSSQCSYYLTCLVHSQCLKAIVLKYFSSRNEGQCEPIPNQLLSILCGYYADYHNIDLLHHPFQENFFFSKQPDLDFCSFLFS